MCYNWQATSIMDNRVESRCLQGLPNELLLNIFGHIPCNFRLASVIRVCHHFKELIDKIEVKSLELRVAFPEQEILRMKPNGRKKHPMYKLLRNFLNRPLSQTQPPWLPPSYDRFCRLFQHLAKHPEMLKEIRSVSVTVQDRSWYFWYFQQSGLLDSLPYLDHLTLSPPPLFSIRFPPLFSTRFSTQISNHERRALKSLRLDFSLLTSKGYIGDAYEGMRDVISHHLYWFKLHKLRIDGLDYAGDNLLRNEMTSIRDLWCVGCRNHESAVTAAELMSSSSSLVRFIFETNASYAAGCNFLEPFPPPLSPFSFYDSGLYWHKAALRQLVIASSDHGIIPRGWTLGLLDKFCQLEKLAAPFFMLPKPTPDKATYEMLPPNLNVLQIQYPFDWDAIIIDDEQDVEAVRNHAGKMNSSLPYLHRFIMWQQKKYAQMAETNGDFLDHVPPERLRMHEQIYEEFGIKFEWVAVSSFWDTPVGKALDAEGDVIIEKGWDALRNFPTLHPHSLMV